MCIRDRARSKEEVIRALRGELKVKEQHMNSLQGEARSKEKVIRALRGELKAKEQRMSTLQGEAKSKEKQIRALNEEMRKKDVCTKKNDCARRSLESQNVALKKRACTPKDKIDRLTDENHQLTAKLQESNDSSSVLGKASKVREDGANSMVRPNEEAVHEHPHASVNPFHNEEGVPLGAALGLALGVGIAGVAALLRK